MDQLIRSAIEGIKAVAEITKAMMDIDSITVMKARLSDLQNAVITAQSATLSANAAHATAIEEVRALKEEIVGVS